MSDFRFSIEDYGLNYYPHEGVYDEQDYIDWSKVECVEIDWVTFVRERTCRLDYERHCSECGVYVHESAVLVWKSLGENLRTVVPKPVNYCPNCGRKVVSA